MILSEMDDFEKFWNRNEEILLKFCELYKTDKDGFKKYIYDKWEKYGMISSVEQKLEKLYKQQRALIYLFGNKNIKVEKITFHDNESKN